MSIDAGFAALSHPLRRSMLDRLSRDPLSISDLADGTGITFAAVSKHLRVLEDAGLVVRRIAGREHHFAAVANGLKPASDWIAEHSRRWQQSLDRLKTLTEDELDDALAALAEVTINAPADRVFAAWCDESLAAKFLCLGDPAEGEARINARVGGEVFVVMADGATRILHRGEFLVVDPPRRLLFTWLSQYTGLRLTVVSVDFEPVSSRRTRVKLRHEGFSDPVSAQSHAGGWSRILQALAGAV